MSRRLYVGRLPPDTQSEELKKHFEGYGSIVDCRVMTGFGFIEFEQPADADDAVRQFDGKSFNGSNIVVEFAKDSRPRREPRDDRGYPPPRGGGGVGRRPPGFRIQVTGLSRDTSWQDLKDFGREAGMVTFADVERDSSGSGVLEYPHREDFENALKILDGRDLRGYQVRVQEDKRAGGGGGDRRDSYRGGGRSRSPRRGGWRDDDRRDSYRRDSRRDDRSPPRRDHREDRDRSPRRDRDDRRNDDRRDRSNRDDRRDREDRHEDRNRSNGDEGWPR